MCLNKRSRPLKVVDIFQDNCIVKIQLWPDSDRSKIECFSVYTLMLQVFKDKLNLRVKSRIQMHRPHKANRQHSRHISSAQYETSCNRIQPLVCPMFTMINQNDVVGLIGSPKRSRCIAISSRVTIKRRDSNQKTHVILNNWR